MTQIALDFLLFRKRTPRQFDGKRIEQLDRKGMVNNRFNAFIMQKLGAAGISGPVCCPSCSRNEGIASTKHGYGSRRVRVRNYAPG